MPRSSPPSAPADITEAPADAGASPSPAAHRYTAPYAVTYVHIPLTCREGDVWAWPDGDAPDDGRWEPTGLPVNTRPDNEPKPEPEGAADHVEEG
jgi:hypothetical protein